ncbi:histidine phosphatase family protein [Demequina sp.]|uniref:histidine phosphatase family protein n=1 Tax=Demequina sp. TaxID=2050685 RepID=UPI0025C2E8E1|nr:histidine phosphatase family protein [Demequina sp.]
MPTVHLVRHGHVHNPDAVLYGRLPNFHLSDTGRKMADAVAEYLVDTGLPVARVIASPLQRAQETATPIARAFGLPIETEPRIIEAGNIYEGETLPTSFKDFVHPRHWWRLRNPWRPSWGEPFKEQAERVWSAIRDAAAATPDGDTVMVSHQLPIWVARLSFEKRGFLHDPRKRECGLASITSFRFEDGEPVQMTYATPAAHIKAPT